MIANFFWFRRGLFIAFILFLLGGLFLIGNPPSPQVPAKAWEEAGQKRIRKALWDNDAWERNSSFASISPLARAAWTEYHSSPKDIQDAAKGLHDAELQILDEAMKLTDSVREEYLQAHATVVEQLNGQDPKAVQLYATALKAAKAKPDDYKPVHDDPVGILVFFQVPDIGLRNYYVENRDWLSEVLASVSYEDSTMRDGQWTSEAALQNMIHRAKRSHPHAREAYREFGAAGFAIAAQYPEFLRGCAERRLPKDQIFEVLFCNPPEEDTANLADEWARIYNSYRPLWEAARREQGVLRLAREVSPELASKVYEKLPADNAAVFLFASWPQHLRPAAEALAKLGQGGLYVLELYGDEKNLNRKRFEALLANQSWRAVQYTLAYGDTGLEAMETNPNAFDKDFNPDGTTRDKEFWTKLPLVGAIGDLVRNVAHNRPLSWEEVGWAGLDVVDGALLVASFGASAPLTAAKGAAKSGMREIARQEVKAIARSAVGKTGRAEAIKAIETKTAKSVLRSWNEAVVSSRIGKGVIGAAKWAGWTIRTLASVGLKTGRVAADKWNAIPESVRKFVMRGLLAASLIAVLLERTIPAIIERIQTSVPKWIESGLDWTSNSLAGLISKAIKSVTGMEFPAESLATWFRTNLSIVLLATGIAGLWSWYCLHRRAIRRATRG